MRVSRSNLKRVALPSLYTGLLRKNSVGLESRFYSAASESRSGLSVEKVSCAVSRRLPFSTYLSFREGRLFSVRSLQSFE